MVLGVESLHFNGTWKGERKQERRLTDDPRQKEHDSQLQEESEDKFKRKRSKASEVWWSDDESSVQPKMKRGI